MTDIQKATASVFLPSIAALLFLSFPLALIPPGYVDLPFHLGPPVLFVAGVFGVSVILCSWGSLSRGWVVAILLFLGSVLLNAALLPRFWVDAVTWSGYVTIPLAVACLARSRQLPRFGILCWVVFVFWGVQMVYEWMAILGGHALSAFSGNRNWDASVLLAALPWAFICVRRMLKRYVKGWRAGFVAFMVTAPATLYVVYQCRSRGAWLALICLAAVVLIHRMSWLWRVVVPVFLGLAAFCLFVRLSGPVAQTLVQTVREDVRIPMWSRTVAMIADNDFFLCHGLGVLGRERTGRAISKRPWLGVGPGQFTRHYAPYRANSTYGMRLVAAPLSIHPHNEFLNVCAELGVMAGFAWLFMLLPLLQPLSKWKLRHRLARFSAFIIIFHAMFDMTLVRSPGNLLALVCLGLIWDVCWSTSKGLGAQTESRLLPVLGRVLFYGSAVVVPAVVVWDLHEDHHFRQAQIASRYEEQAKCIGHYRKVLKVAPRNILANLHVGNTFLSQFHLPGAALRHFTVVQQEDPSFAHVNDSIGKALLAQGLHEQARAFFLRDRVLFPWEEGPLQRLFTCALAGGRLNELPEIAVELDALHEQKLRLQYEALGFRKMVSLWKNAPPGIGMDELVEGEFRRLMEEKSQAWLRAVAEGDCDRAVAAADALRGKGYSGFVDPLFALVTPDQSWPPEVIGSDFKPTDYDYWRTLCFYENILLEAGTPSAARHGDWDEVLGAFFRQVKIDPALKDYRPPERVWYEGTGSPLAAYICLAGLMRQYGRFTVIHTNEADEIDFCYVFDNKEVRKIDLAAQTVVMTPVRSERPLKLPFKMEEGHCRIVFMPQEYFLKNRALGAVVSKFDPRNPLRTDHIPTLNLLLVLNACDALPLARIRQLREYVISAPTDALYERFPSSAKGQRMRHNGAP